jgi:hypothetical protein
MADVKPLTTFHVAFSEKEYKLVMHALAALAAPDVIKAEGRDRQDAAVLNVKLLEVERAALQQRLDAVDKKLGRAPVAEVELTGDAATGAITTAFDQLSKRLKP